MFKLTIHRLLCASVSLSRSSEVADSRYFFIHCGRCRPNCLLRLYFSKQGNYNKPIKLYGRRQKSVGLPTLQEVEAYRLSHR